MRESMLTGEVPVCREDVVELDGSPYGSATGDAAETEEGRSEPFRSSGGVQTSN